MPYIESPSHLIGPGCFVLTCAAIHLTRTFRLAQPSTERLVSLDGLRGVLAFGVFVHHFFAAYQWKHTGAWQPPASHLYGVMGGFCVILFFMVTGFLFFGKVKATRGELDLDRFFIGRVFRLVPVYAVSVVLVCVQRDNQDDSGASIKLRA